MSTIVTDAMHPDIEKAKEIRNKKYEALVEQYGNYTNIPFEETLIINEELRAVYCFVAQPNLSKTEVLKHYSIDRRVWGNFVEVSPEDTAIVKKPKRADKYDAVFEYAKEHLFEQITPQTIMEIGEISYPTALKLISDRPDIFRKIKKGLYEIRDAEADRKAEKR